MSCNYFTAFEVAIRPEAIESLAKAVNVGKSILLGAFELHGDTLCCVFSGLCSFQAASAIEQFTRGAVSDAAAESIVVTEETDGVKTSYGIGPDGARVFSAHCCDEITKLARSLSLTDSITALAAVQERLDSRERLTDGGF